MEREVATLEKGTQCCSWNHCGQRLAAGNIDGTISIHDSIDPSSNSSLSLSSQWKAHASSIRNVVWVPPEFGDAIACICTDGALSLWEEVEEDSQPLKWKQCKVFEITTSGALDLQFGVSGTSLKLAEFQNVIDLVSRFAKPLCLSASIAWNPQRGESQQSSFVLGYNSDLSQFNSPKALRSDSCRNMQGKAIWHVGLTPESDGRL